MVTVIFSRAQRRFTNGEERVELEAHRVDALVRALYARFSDLDGMLDGAAVSINGVIHNDAPYERLPDGAEVHFVGAVAGGSGDAIVEDEAAYALDPLIQARDWVAAGRRVAMATVLETWGSSPCPPGSRLVVDEAGHFEGSVSGGCVEGAVIERAAQVIEDGRPTTLEFGVADEEAWAVGLACGGRVRVYVERID
jgi:molybdopterin converting factor small subunit